MPVIREEKNNNYTVMSNYHLRDTRLSVEAKGIMSIMLSLPDDWDYSVNGLAGLCRKSGYFIKKTLDELKNNGYLELVGHFEASRIKYDYFIYEKPRSGCEKPSKAFQSTEIETSEIESSEIETTETQSTEIESSETQSTEIQQQLNTNIPNTEELSTYISNKEQTNTSKKIPRKEKKTPPQRADFKAGQAESVCCDDFEKIWDIYPKKVDKQSAYRAYRSRLHDGYTSGDILSGVSAYVNSMKKAHTEMRYYKNLSTFLGPDKPFLEWKDKQQENSRNYSPDYDDVPYPEARSIGGADCQLYSPSASDFKVRSQK